MVPLPTLLTRLGIPAVSERLFQRVISSLVTAIRSWSCTQASAICPTPANLHCIPQSILPSIIHLPGFLDIAYSGGRLPTHTLDTDLIDIFLHGEIETWRFLLDLLSLTQYSPSFSWRNSVFADSASAIV